MGSKALRRQRWRCSPAVCDPGSRQTPRTKLHCRGKMTLGKSARGQRVEPHQRERKLRRRISRGKPATDARSKGDRRERRRGSKEGDTKRRHHVRLRRVARERSPRLRVFKWSSAVIRAKNVQRAPKPKSAVALRLPSSYFGSVNARLPCRQWLRLFDNYRVTRSGAVHPSWPNPGGTFKITWASVQGTSAQITRPPSAEYPDVARAVCTSQPLPSM
jgi:hypothetical protein